MAHETYANHLNLGLMEPLFLQYAGLLLFLRSRKIRYASISQVCAKLLQVAQTLFHVCGSNALHLQYLQFRGSPSVSADATLPPPSPPLPAGGFEI